MLYFSRWKMIAILGTALIISVCNIPNFFSKATFDALPKWAQRHIVLGLDLQGGSHLLLQVDVNAVRAEMVTNLRDDVRRVLREGRIGYTNLAARGMTVEVRIREDADLTEALRRLRGLSVQLGGIFSGTGQNSLEIAQDGRLVRLTVTEPAINDRISQAVAQSIQIVERRVNELGTVEPLIQRQGADRLLVQVPGLQDPTRLKELIGQTAKLVFRFVDMSVTPEQAQQGRLPPDSELMRGTKKEGGNLYVIEKQVIVSGEDLIDAQPGFDQRTNEPIVTFRFNSRGSQAFARATQANVGRPFAIILDNEVISAPVIREAILGGSGQISGNFTVEAANDLAILLRAGALPAPLTIVEERTVGAGLGQDSIEKGRIAAVIGSVLVVAFIFATYGLLGTIANVALIVNIAMLLGVLSLLNATLTLPGIAGIVLTVGMAVDSNVLIYERMREESRSGRTAINAIDAGFTRALATILDANFTTLIAAVVLFFLGSGPVRGFAVTLIIGIFTTVFTAFTFTRLLVAVWVRFSRPAAVPI